jgi:DNA-binding transcriptional LysR family regulator
MDMDVAVLRWFQQVADGMTVTEVSELEAVTQSGVSRALARLDAEIGTPLLQRSGRVLRMTRAGSAFKRHVDAMLHELDDGLAAVTEVTAPDTGTVAVAFQISLGTWLVPELVASFRAEHPDVRFELHQIRDELLARPLHDGSADLELTAVRSTDPAIRFRPLLDEPLRLAVPRDHPLAASGTVQLQQAAGEQFVLLRRTYALRRLVEDLCATAGFTPAVAFEGDDLPTVEGFVAAGLGVAIVPQPPERWRTDRSAVRYLALSDAGAVRQVGVAWSSSRRLPPAADAFLRHLTEMLRGRSIH